jgi:hypothetical protein
VTPSSRKFRVCLQNFQGFRQVRYATGRFMVVEDPSEAAMKTRARDPHSGVISMRRNLWLVVLGSLITSGPGIAQESKRPFTPSGEIQIPSGAAIDRMLDSDTLPPPDKEFSRNDAKAIEEMDQRAKRIDRDVMRGICTGC